MKIDKKKLDIAKARACMGSKEIEASGFPKGTYCGILQGRNVKPETMGRLARVLGVDVTEIIETVE